MEDHSDTIRMVFEEFILSDKIEDMSKLRVPECFPEKEKLQSYLAVIKRIKFYSLLGERLGFGHRVHLLRKLFAKYFAEDENETAKEPASDPKYQCYYTTMDDTGVKVYKPITQASDQLLPCLIFFHGGGWTLGSADEMDEMTMKIAKGAGIMVVSVNYRMAPEHLFPAAIEDCINVTKYILYEGDQHGIDTACCAVAGDSAGGNLAAATAQQLQEDDVKPPLKLQVLLYPCLQGVDFNLQSYQENHDDPYLDRNLMISFWLWYLQGTAQGDVAKCRENQHLSAADRHKLSELLGDNRVKLDDKDNSSHLQSKDKTDIELNSVLTSKMFDPLFSPLLRKSLRGLPKTYIVTCEQDVVKDEGVMYAQRLKQDAVQVQHVHYNSVHAFLDFQDLKFTKDAMEKLIEYLITELK